MKCTSCAIPIQNMDRVEDATWDELLCDRCYERHEYPHVIDRIRSRQADPLGPLADLPLTDEDQEDLADVWRNLNTEVFDIFDQAPTYAGDTSTLSDTGMSVRLHQPSMIWLCQYNGKYSLMGEAEISCVTLLPHN